MRRLSFIAEQSRHARVWVGRIVAWVMAKETHRDNQRAINALEIQSTDHVLDIGTGHGRALAELAMQAPSGFVTGVDPSSLMAEIAVARNKALIRTGQLRVLVAGVEALPFTDSSFDRAMAVHVAYFWPNLGRALSEIARVLKPGGRLVLVFRSAQDLAATESFPDSIYKFRSVCEMRDALAHVGLIEVPIVEQAGAFPMGEDSASILTCEKTGL
jgi:ubiquinone/menaquinone biosynthesis C-methylase UbiE